MGRYKTTHEDDFPIFNPTKTSRIKDTKTGNEGRGVVWDFESFKEADKKAWEDLQKRNNSRK